MKTVTFKLTNSFADETARTLEFGPFGEGVINSETLRTNAKTFDVAAISDTYLSDAGAKFTGISGVTIFETDEREINLNVEE